MQNRSRLFSLLFRGCVMLKEKRWANKNQRVISKDIFFFKSRLHHKGLLMKKKSGGD